MVMKLGHFDFFIVALSCRCLLNGIVAAAPTNTGFAPPSHLSDLTANSKSVDEEAGVAMLKSHMAEDEKNRILEWIERDITKHTSES
ncbi:hypothetical protein H0H93_005058, partial [Arthromyces matolae]